MSAIVRTTATAALIISAAAAALRLIANPPVSRYIVEGPSMEPAYRAGDRLLVNRVAYRKQGPAPGDVVVVRDPERKGHLLLKRIAPHPYGESVLLYVLGDNAAHSRDSRQFGPIAREEIVGKAWLKY
jgi:nickel-type superoxide dismutase maturation protease